MVTIHDLLEAGVHFGHQTRFWNPKMESYIYGTYRNIHIINLEKTIILLQEALNFLNRIAAQKGRILFVGTKPAAQELVKEYADRCGMPYINYRWLGGMLTNYKTLRYRIKRLKELDTQFENENFGNLTKKEILILSRSRDKLERALGGVKRMGGLPDALFVIDIGYEKIAVQEANKLAIPVVGIVDTNSNPAKIQYIIPGNDDSIKAIELYLKLAAESIQNAKSSSNVVFSKEESLGTDEFVEVSEEKIQQYEDEMQTLSEEG